MRTLIAAACLLGSSALASAAPLMVPITACGDTVPRHAIGYLTADLDCTGFNGFPVLLNRQATLELRGFTLKGGIVAVECGEMRPREDLPPALYNSGKCTVIGGGGRVTGADAHGIAGDAPIVSDLTIDGCGQGGVYARYDVRLTGVTVSGSGTFGLRIDRNAFVTGSSITGSAENGIVARRLRLIDSTVTGNGIGPSCGPYPLAQCADLATAKRPRLDDSSCGTSLVGQQGYPKPSWGVCALD
jgi:hypothetical protein